MGVTTIFIGERISIKTWSSSEPASAVSAVSNPLIKLKLDSLIPLIMNGVTNVFPVTRKQRMVFFIIKNLPQKESYIANTVSINSCQENQSVPIAAVMSQ